MTMMTSIMIDSENSPLGGIKQHRTELGNATPAAYNGRP